MILYDKLSTKSCDAIACGLPDIRRTHWCLLDYSQKEPLLSVCEKFHQLFSAHDKLQSKDCSLLQLLGLQAGRSLP